MEKLIKSIQAHQSHCQSLHTESFCRTEQLLQSGYHPTPHDQNIHVTMSNANYCSPLESQDSSRIYLANCQAQNRYENTRENADLSWGQLERADFRALNHLSGTATVHATRTQYGNGGKTAYLLPSRDPVLVEAFNRTHFSMQSRGEGRGKRRIRWTQELHELFVEAVNNLGGAMKATPKGILGLMKYEGLTVFHIKSHLQKYRTTKCVPNLLHGKAASPVSGLKGSGGFHALETLRMQMDVQRSLQEHLEFQKKLQLRIEEHANYLERMFDQQKRRCTFFENHNSVKAANQCAEFSPQEEYENHDRNTYHHLQHLNLV
ncbi:protein PHOSPHATE STARVATION RESPONSE 3-like isoform X2 [Typha latifolia]|uniref:protein PHOSPHATE STARVATION RESPONSE 3-like isoform X2 n=1 Tax=Typha latifolia TaxID=4733 RepID=UPI003C2B8032